MSKSKLRKALWELLLYKKFQTERMAVLGWTGLVNVVAFMTGNAWFVPIFWLLTGVFIVASYLWVKNH